MESSDSEVEEPWGDQENRNPAQIPNNIPILHNSISPWNKEFNCVTTLYKCNASDARGLYIFDGAYKLLQNDQYDIGGAYSEDSGLWFYFTTSLTPGHNYLMSIFVCQRKPGVFSLGISNSNNLTSTIYNNDKVIMLSTELDWQKFCSTMADEVHHIKTFNFSKEDQLSLVNMVFVIPIQIDMTSRSFLNRNVIQKIKAEHDFGEKLLKDLAPDFTLQSGEGKKYEVHKIALAAHSPVLRDLIKAKECKNLNLDIVDSEIDLLLQYLYSGTIKDILKQPMEKLLLMANKFQMQNLIVLVKYAMKMSITSENVLDVAVLAETYKYKDVQEAAFKYIAHHPEVLNTDAFSRITNANVVKDLLRYIHVKASN